MTEKLIQLEANNELRNNGWVFWYPPRTWGERDIMGVFDLMAVKRSRHIFIQLTTEQHISDRKKKILSFYEANNIKLNNVYIWAWHRKKNKFIKVKI